MSSPEKFLQQIDAFGGQDIPEMVETMHKKIMQEALARLVLRTPVNTGYARGNWQVGLLPRRPSGQVDVSPLLPRTREPKFQSPPPLSTTGQRAMDEGAQQIRQIEAFSTSHVTNNTSYIDLLEDGGSQQCPPGGMLIRTFEDLTEMFR